MGSSELLVCRLHIWYLMVHGLDKMTDRAEEEKKAMAREGKTGNGRDDRERRSASLTTPLTNYLPECLNG